VNITNIIQNDIDAAYPEIQSTRFNVLLTFVNSAVHVFECLSHFNLKCYDKNNKFAIDLECTNSQ